MGQVIAPERIIAAAIQGPDGSIYHSLKPARHGDVIQAIIYKGVVDVVPGDWPQGFITSKLRFVDRREAYLIAKERGQLGRTAGPGPELYSEDVW